ncbi:MAG TPA: amidohydrolase family protein [Gemmatimonadaceae bacterium]|nr:amidohydrolase family protein [Gemmatimonadaceae bacterium]
MRFLVLTCFAAAPLLAQRPALGPMARQMVVVDSPVVAIRNVRVIDGTGAPARDGQTLVMSNGKITALGAAASTAIPAGAHLIDGSGKTVLPGFVLVHEHMFYPAGGAVYHEFPFSFPRLYLAGGVTTARTGGNMAAYADINLKRQIDAGTVPGPKLDVTAPYLNGPNPFVQMYALKDAADARRFVNLWAGEGATSFKAYMQITRAQLGAAIEEAHRRGLKVTGHLCSVTYREAAALGIDNLEHGFLAASDFAASKAPDQCPGAQIQYIANMTPETDTVARSIIRALVDRRVALTSTLAIFESFTPGRPATPLRVLDAMSPDARSRYLQSRAATAGQMSSPYAKAFPNAMKLEKMFHDAGGMLVAGTDPTGYGGVLPGFGSQRTIELLVEAGLTPLEAIRVATLNGATYLGRSDRVGSLAVGKDADVLLVAGDPGTRIADIARLEIVFKDGVGFDSARLIERTKGMVGAQ